MRITNLLTISLLLPFTSSFNIPAKGVCSRQLVQCQAVSKCDRRSFLSFGSIATLAISTPAYADVADGNALPDGALQFKRLLRLKTDLAVSLKVYFVFELDMTTNTSRLEGCSNTSSRACR